MISISIGLFDILGPIMMGPSSSHTAGAVRIGYFARQIIGCDPEQVILYFHPVLMQTYKGHRTHEGILAGLLGYREDQSEGLNSLREIKVKGIDFSIKKIIEKNAHQNTMLIKAKARGKCIKIKGVSVGGGSICITEIDDIPVELNGETYVLLIRSSTALPDNVKEVLASYPIIKISEGQTASGYLTCINLKEKPQQEQLMLLQSYLPEVSVNLIQPLYEFRQVDSKAPFFSTLAELLNLADKQGLPSCAISYESKRTKKSEQQIRAACGEILDSMLASIKAGLKGNNSLLGGFCSGDDGRKIMSYYKGNNTVVGGILSLAIARAISVAEVNAAGGRIVAAPTAGAAGVIPAIILSVAERFNKTKGDMIDSLLVAAAIGICINNKVSFSGAVGGCQGEIGVAAAMAAAAATYLSSGGAEACVHASALTLKNILGLVCDPAAGPVEVPCIKRNAIGVAAALAAAEMVTAGIRSYIPPDEVVDALSNVQQLLPQELKGSCIGGLGCTKTSKCMKEALKLKINSYTD